MFKSKSYMLAALCGTWLFSTVTVQAQEVELKLEPYEVGSMMVLMFKTCKAEQKSIYVSQFSGTNYGEWLHLVSGRRTAALGWDFLVEKEGTDYTSWIDATTVSKFKCGNKVVEAKDFHVE
jgi:hypothetical protein